MNNLGEDCNNMKNIASVLSKLPIKTSFTLDLSFNNLYVHNENIEYLGSIWEKWGSL